jgi:hypothetical protein
MPRKRVILESPYAGDRTHVLYLIQAMHDSINRGEAPFASHLIYPLILRDGDPTERAIGIECGYAWMRGAQLQVFYTDRGWSTGMLDAFKVGYAHALPYEFRGLYGPPEEPPDGNL